MYDKKFQDEAKMLLVNLAMWSESEINEILDGLIFDDYIKSKFKWLQIQFNVHPLVLIMISFLANSYDSIAELMLYKIINEAKKKDISIVELTNAFPEFPNLDKERDKEIFRSEMQKLFETDDLFYLNMNSKWLDLWNEIKDCN